MSLPFHRGWTEEAVILWALQPDSETLFGVFVVDKPENWTSHDVVSKMRRIAATKKIGHLGTLDPLATGVLPLLVGRATRLARFFTNNTKSYDATIHFGYATDTYDAQGTPTTPETAVVLDRDQISAALTRHTGKILQVPPPVSAKKVDGVRSYKLVRMNKAVVLDAVEVEIFSIELLRCEGADTDIRVHCGSGTYIRSIAHDLGQELGSGAFLQRLRRTSSGGFGIDHARSLEELQALADQNELAAALIPAAKLLPEFPCERVDDTTAGFLRQGREFRASPFRPAASSRHVKFVSESGELVAIGEAKMPNVYHPAIVF